MRSGVAIVALAAMALSAFLSAVFADKVYERSVAR